MPDPSTPPDASRLLDEACAWVGRMHSGDFGRDERRALAAWRAADPAHERAWRKAQGLWQGMEALRGRAVPGAEPLLQEHHRKPAPVPVRRHPGCRKWPLAAACCGVLAVSLAAFYPPALWQADYRTGTGEQRSIRLADGSRVLLNTDTALAVHFDAALRRIELLRGEAFFEVARDALHPFVVTSAGREVRAVGTAFDVRRQDGQTHVELVEGIVDIQDARHRQRRRLRAGESATISAERVEVESVRRTQGMALWREGYLQFDGLPLGEAVAQINRYRPGKVVLLNPDLVEKRITGLFRLNELERAVSSLKTAVPQLQMIKITPYLVVLR